MGTSNKSSPLLEFVGKRYYYTQAKKVVNFRNSYSMEPMTHNSTCTRRGPFLGGVVGGVDLFLDF